MSISYGGKKRKMRIIKWLDKIIIKENYKKRRKEIPNPICDWPINVVSRDMGCDRGKSISRVYIEKFLNNHMHYITGDVMEIGSNIYTIQYGKNVQNSYIFTADKGTEGSKVILGDLASGVGCEDDFVDCFILTQTLPFIYDMRSVASNIIRMLKKGGTALITVPGITMLSSYDDSRWGHYWGFTETSLRKIFENLVSEEQIEVFSMGNPKTASAYIYGLSSEDLKPMDFETDDALVPIIIAAVIHK